MIKTILVLADGRGGCEAVLSTAGQLAERFGACLEVIHVRPDAAMLVPIIDEGVSGPVIDQMLAAAEDAIKGRATNARAAYARLSARLKTPVTWHELTGREAAIAAASGRLSDLVVVGRSDGRDDAAWTETVEALLFDTGRPVLMLPSTPLSTVGRRVAVAWNGSAQAARATAAALPFLRAAETTSVLTAGPTDPLASPDGVALYLQRHDVKATTEPLGTDPAAIGKKLLEHSHRIHADLLVMGAYGHSRLRETILGGATREVLATADLPVLLAH